MENKEGAHLVVVDTKVESSQASDLASLNLTGSKVLEPYSHNNDSEEKRGQGYGTTSELERAKARDGIRDEWLNLEVPYSYIKDVTDNFSESLVIGEGGFGKVFRAKLDGRTVAIKVLDSTATQGEREFFREIEVLYKMQHPHLVKLVGACFKGVRALVYEYLPNGSLEDCLKENPQILTWQMRTRILYEICSALSYLHSKSMIHANLKPANVLIDANFKSKLSDFGLCRFLPEDMATTLFLETSPIDTLGYTDPWFLETCILKPGSDLYSLGITVLKLLTGMPPIGLGRKIRDTDEKSLKKMIDPTAGNWPFELATEMVYWSLQCCYHNEKSSEVLMDMSTSLLGMLEEIETLQGRKFKPGQTIQYGSRGLKPPSYNENKKEIMGTANPPLSSSSLEISSTMDLPQTCSRQFEGEVETTLMTYQQSKNSGEEPWKRCPVENSTIYGREDDEKSVIELLLSSDCRERNVSVIHIFSSAGVGKTTLASLVYSNSRVCEIFETRVWICSTEGFDAMGHAKVIIEALTGISCCLTEPVEVQETLKEELVGKRFLLVLDNICDDDVSFWSSLLVPLSAGAKGSIVIATSRSNLVSNMGVIHSYELKLLSEDSCWMIFQHLAFNRRDYDVKSNVIKIGKQIVTKCGRLPLSVKALGGILCLANSEKTWSTVLESDLWNTNGILPALRLSYAHLPVYLKRCFGYCSLFPKGYLFERDHLVHLWLSQGFIEHKEEKRVEDTGNEYIDELLKRSFFQQSPICDSIEGKYVMHDLFHDLAESVSVKECFRSESYKFSTIPRMVHHMSLVPRNFDKVLEFETLKKSKDIHTCLLINRFGLKWDTSIFHIKNSAILDDLFLQCSFLRTLDLGSTNIEAIPDSIANLKHLCYLGLNKTNIKSLPEPICDLCNLQVLELQDCSYLHELPKGTKNLATLRHLDVWKESGFILMPSGIGQLTGLQTLSAFHVGRDKQYCGIRELKDMVNLRGTLCIGGLENVINGEEAKEANLRIKAHICSLTLEWCDFVLDLDNDDSAGAASEVLLNLQANTNLEELIIRNYCGDRFSSWVGDPSFSKLISITLDNCFECDVLPPLGHLLSLKYLAIRMMDGVQSIRHEFLGPVSMISHRFPSLEILKLSEMSELAEWCGVESGDFPHLHSISISRCHKLRRLPSFTSLVELTVHCCTEFPDLPTLPCLESLKIEGIQNLKFFPLLPDMPALKMLDIKHCTLLSSVRDLSHLPSVERLKVINCPKLHFSPHEKLPSMLQTVEIHRGCALLKDWCPIGFEEISDAHQVTRKLSKQKEQDKEVP